ncbi:aldo/keto reductase [Piscinibacter sakaiensis]|uniref:aldo/keto reductase n=1 Tax=Piscinibacter sakaiensis TaxID=1547922 RepID=UPI003AAF8E77
MSTTSNKGTSEPAVMPRLGLGTWRIGERASQRGAECAAVRLAIELGYRLIDTAEMYGEGGAESVVGEALGGAIAERVVDRDEMVLVSKVYPHNASRRGVVDACRRSLERMQVEHLDLYLLHWRGDHPLAETIEGFERLRADGLIRRWGVSNFDTSDMAELLSLPGGRGCATNQIYFSLAERGPAFSLLPWMRERGIGAMAYSPIDQGALASSDRLMPIAERLGVTAAQLALAWVLAQPDVVAIPKAVQRQHLRDNLAAAELKLSRSDLDELDRIFPPPARKRPLAMI